MRRTERAEALAERFGSNKRKIEKCVWQDEKDFCLEVPLNPQNSRVYGDGKNRTFQIIDFLIKQTSNLSRLWCQPVLVGMALRSHFL